MAIERHLQGMRTKCQPSFSEVRHLRGRHLRGFTVPVYQLLKKVVWLFNLSIQISLWG